MLKPEICLGLIILVVILFDKSDAKGGKAGNPGVSIYNKKFESSNHLLLDDRFPSRHLYTTY